MTLKNIVVLLARWNKIYSREYIFLFGLPTSGSFIQKPRTSTPSPSSCTNAPAPPLKTIFREGGVCNQATVRLGLSFLLQFFLSDKYATLTTSAPYVVRQLQGCSCPVLTSSTLGRGRRRVLLGILGGGCAQCDARLSKSWPYFGPKNVVLRPSL